MRDILVLIMILLSSISNISWSDLIQNYNIENDFSLVQTTNFTAYVISNVYVRTRPDSNSEKLGILYVGEEVQVTGIKDDWYEVRYNNNRGYTKSCYLEKSDFINYKSCIYTEGNVNNKYAEKLLRNYSSLPENVRYCFESDNSRIILKSLNEGVLGTTNYNLGRADIYIDDSDDAILTIYHEIGHYIDGELDNISISDNFKLIWQKESDILASWHTTAKRNIDSSSEYFAESCLCYFTDSIKLKEQCPLTYTYIKNCIDSI